MCDRRKSLEKRFKGNEEEFRVSSSFVAKTSYLRHVQGYPRQKYVSSEPAPHPITYPKAHMYYGFSEDTNPFTRVPTSCKFSPDDCDIAFKSPEEPFIERDPYLKSRAKVKYLKKEPVCFVIFGKPDLGGSKLAKLIADAWQCVLISPQVLIRDEINEMSETGCSMLKMLQQGQSIGPEIIIKLIENRMRKRDVAHRGYIVEGLPLIPNNPDLDFSSYPGLSVDEGRETDTNVSFTSSLNRANNDDISRASDCKVDKHHEQDIPNQINNIFMKWPIRPTIIIYIACPNKDIIRKREQTRFNAETGENINYKLLDVKKNNFYPKDWENVEGFPITFDRIIVEEQNLLREDESKYLLKRLIDSKENIESQCAMYEKFALPIIDNWILAHNPQNVIRVDGRTSTMRMMEIINTRLRILPLSRLVLPVEIFKEREIELKGEETLEEAATTNFEKKSIHEVYNELKNMGTVALAFPWRLSIWKYSCPVELVRGRLITGNPKHSVRFMDELYFLASKANASLFVENPRPFLLPPNPKVPCKIVIFGPKHSGKTELSNKLAEAFDGVVIDIDEAEKIYIEQYRNDKINKAKSDFIDDVISELNCRLNHDRAARENERSSKLQTWLDDISAILNRLVNIEKSAKEKEINRSEAEILEIGQKLQESNISFLMTDQAMREQFLANKELLYDYAPDNLQNEEEPVRKLTKDDDEVKANLEERVKHLYNEQIELSADQKTDIVIQKINVLSKKLIEENLYRDADFIIDGMYADVDVWTKIVEENGVKFEDVIILFEEEPYDYFINKYYHFIYDDSTEKSDSEADSSILGGEREESAEDFEDYIEQIKDFNAKLTILKEKIEAAGIPTITYDLSRNDSVLKYVVDFILDRFKVKARILTDNEKVEKNVLSETINSEMKTEEAVDDVGEESKEKKHAESENLYTMKKKDNLNLGDTSYYCPVALLKYHVFWRGSVDFSAFYDDKVYLLSNENALNEFIDDPGKLGLPLIEPLTTIPPLRISVIGPTGSGKTNLSIKLSNHLGLMHIDYLSTFTSFLEDRGMLSLDSKAEIICPEDLPESIDLPEELNSEMYNINEATIHTFVRQYWQSGGHLPKNMLEECLLKYFKSPLNECGFVLDGFPSCIEDVDAMLNRYAVPEIIIELYCDIETTIERMMPVLLNLWTQEQKRRKDLEKNRYDNEMENYLNEREKWINERIKQSRLYYEEENENPYESNMEDFDDVEKIEYPNADLALIDRTELEEIWRINHDEPKLFVDWEDVEAAEERMLNALRERYASSIEKITDIRNSVQSRTVPWIRINSQKDETTIWHEILKVLRPYAHHENFSILEHACKIDGETAERLLDCGYYFLSSFGRLCPVQVYKRKVAIHMFLPMEARQEIYPTIHRRYIYFLGGIDAFDEFRQNPLKYIQEDSCLPLIAPRISIIGPPKCGKTTLAKRFASTYGMKVISPGGALRYVLRNFAWTEFARVTESDLRLGHSASNESISRAVEMCSIDSRAGTQGYILDGFPCNREEAEKLAFLGIQPMMFLDIKADRKFCLECSSRDADVTKKPANFSPAYLTHRYEQWRKNESSFRDWLRKFAQNIIDVDGSPSKWGVWTTADRVVQTRLLAIQKYFREADYDKVHSLEYLCVSPYEFRMHQSRYESFCPLCLFHDGTINFSGAPPHRSGVFQFRRYYYWVCRKHADDFLRNPSKHLPPINTSELPKERPKILEETIDIHHGCWAKRLRADGNCLVTYVDNLPGRKLVSGFANIAVIYKDKLYLFCSEKCLRKFLSTPEKYARAKLHFLKAFPPIDINCLPNIGYLEQTVARILIHAVNQVSVIRPKLPGMSPSVTAAIYIGIYLKIYNMSCKLQEFSVYQEALKRARARVQILRVATRNMKKIINPYIIIPKRVYSTTKVTAQVSYVSEISVTSINNSAECQESSSSKTYENSEKRAVA